jgi:uncharacterized protein YecE (DUF72 family)
MSKKKGRIWIGTSGYQYDHWKDRFYPEDLPKNEWFSYYARQFETVEINNTFYNLPGEKTFKDWEKNTPEGFCYALKFSRYGTHMKKLKDPSKSVPNFIERAELLKEHLGPILVQLPPGWNVDVGRLEAFLDAAPEKHRWAVEFRDKSWLCDEVYEVLREHNAALVVHDMMEDHPREVTADWVYERYHGDHYSGSYTHQALSASADRYEEYRDDGLDVFAYFNNDAEGHAPANAHDVRRYIGQVE